MAQTEVRIQYVPIFVPVFVPVFIPIFSQPASGSILRMEELAAASTIVFQNDSDEVQPHKLLLLQDNGVPKDVLGRQHSKRPSADVHTFVGEEQKHFELYRNEEERALVNEAITFITTSPSHCSSCVSGGQYFFGGNNLHVDMEQRFEGAFSSSSLDSSPSSPSLKKCFKMAQSSSSSSQCVVSASVRSAMSSVCTSPVSSHSLHHRHHHRQQQRQNQQCSTCFSTGSSAQVYIYSPSWPAYPTWVPTTNTTTTTTNNCEKLSVCSCCCVGGGQQYFGSYTTAVDQGFDLRFVWGTDMDFVRSVIIIGSIIRSIMRQCIVS
jgi:hypothetical protein